MPHTSAVSNSYALAVQDFQLLPPSQLTAWHHQHANRTVTSSSSALKPYGLSLITDASAKNDSDSDSDSVSITITHSTALSFHYAHTRVVMLLDLSASLFTVDPLSYEPLYLALIQSLTTTLRHIVSSPALSKTTLTITVVGCTTSLSSPLHMLVHSAQLTVDNESVIVQMVVKRVMEIENYQALAHSHPHPHNHTPTHTHHTSLHTLLQYGSFALDRLDPSAAPVLILLSDCVISTSTSMLGYDSLLASLQRRGVRLSIIQLTSSRRSESFAYGLVAETEMVKYAARCTGGVFYDRQQVKALSIDERHYDSDSDMTPLEQAVFVRQSMIQPWPAQHSPSHPVSSAQSLLHFGLVRHKNRPSSIAPLTSRLHPPLTLPAGVTNSDSDDSVTLPSLVLERVKRLTLSVDLLRLLECRHREGFICYVRDGVYVLRREWQPRVFIEYHIHNNNTTTHTNADVGQKPPLSHARSVASFSINIAAPSPPTRTRTIPRPSTLSHTNIPTRHAVQSLTVQICVIADRALLDALHAIKHHHFKIPVKDESPSLDPNDSHSYAHHHSHGHSHSHITPSHMLVSSILQSMYEADVMLVHLARLALTHAVIDSIGHTTSIDSTELLFTYAKSDILKCTPTRAYRRRGRHRQALPAPQSQPQSSSQPPIISLPPLPSFVSSSYLSPSHPLWHRLASLPLSSWYRWFSIQSFDILCSLYRRSRLEVNIELELELELEIDFASLARVQSASNLGAMSSSFARAVSTLTLPRQLSSVSSFVTSSVSMPSSQSPSPSPSQSQPQQQPLSSPTNAGTINGASVSEIQHGSNVGQQAVAESLTRLMQGWSSVTVSNACFVHFPAPPDYHSNSTPTIHDKTIDDIPLTVMCESYANIASASLPFAIVRLIWRTKYLASITVAFHACDSLTQATIIHTLQSLISHAFIVVRSSVNSMPRRSLPNDNDNDDQSEPTTPVLDNETQQRQPSQQSSKSGASYINSTHDAALDRGKSSVSAASTDSFSSSQNLLANHWPLAEDRLYPFGLTKLGLESILLRPSFILASATSSSVFESLFPSPSSSTSSYHSSRHYLSVLRSYMRYHTWLWSLSSTVSMKGATRLLRNARTEEGFVLVASTGKASTWIRHIHLRQATVNDSNDVVVVNDGDSDDDCGAGVSCFIQYCVTEIDATHIQTDLWMEPHFGVYSPSASASTTKTTPDHLSSEEFFQSFSRFLHCCDLHILSAVSTFDAIRDLEYNPDIAARLQSNTNSHTQSPVTVAVNESSGLALQLETDWHASRSFDYDSDHYHRFQSRFNAINCHPSFITTIGSVSNGLAKTLLRRNDSTSQLYASLLASPSTSSIISLAGNASGSSAAKSEFTALLSPESSRYVGSSVSRSHYSAAMDTVTPVKKLTSNRPSLSKPFAFEPPNSSPSSPQSDDENDELLQTGGGGGECRRQSVDGDHRNNSLRRQRSLFERIPLSLTYLLECATATVFKFTLPSELLPTAINDSIRQLGDATPPLRSTPPRMSPYHSKTHSTSSIDCSEQLPPSSLSLSSLALSSNLTYFRQLHVWLIESLRSLADIELIRHRCFAQLVNEYTCIVIVLPCAPSVTNTNANNPATPSKKSIGGHRKSLSGPQLSHSQSISAGVRAANVSEASLSDVDELLDELLSANAGATLPIVDINGVTLQAVFVECSRDNLAHPRSKPQSNASNDSDGEMLADGHSSRQFLSNAERQQHADNLAVIQSFFTLPALCRMHENSGYDSEKQQLVVDRALALALGFAVVSHQAAPPSPVRTPSNSPMLSPMLSPLKSPRYQSLSIGSVPLHARQRLLSSPSNTHSGIDREPFSLAADLASPTAKRNDDDDDNQRSGDTKGSRTNQSSTTDSSGNGHATAASTSPNNTSTNAPPFGSPLHSPTFAAQSSVAAHMRKFIHDVYALWREKVHHHQQLQHEHQQQRDDAGDANATDVV